MMFLVNVCPDTLSVCDLLNFEQSLVNPEVNMSVFALVTVMQRGSWGWICSHCGVSYVLRLVWFMLCSPSGLMDTALMF